MRALARLSWHGATDRPRELKRQGCEGAHGAVLVLQAVDHGVDREALDSDEAHLAVSYANDHLPFEDGARLLNREQREVGLG